MSIYAKNRAWREIDLQALIHNAHALQHALPAGSRLMAVLKADAYGHGAPVIARTLSQNGVDHFAVACLDEGIALRKQGIRGQILVLGYTPPEAADQLVRWQLTQTVADAAHGRALSAAGYSLLVHLALDTGMHRLGIDAGDSVAIMEMFRLPHLQICGVFSHLCVADSLLPQDRAYTQKQLTAFFAAIDAIRANGYDPGDTHIQASYGLLNLPPQPCSCARIGIALYGLSSDTAPVAHPLPLSPVLSLRARIAAIRPLAAGEGAGYGLAYRAKQDCRIAVVTIGYADGLPRALSACGGRALVHGVSCPMCGRICMDQLLLDVSAVPEAAPGDIVTLIGQDGPAVLRAEDVAVQCGTITNELLSRLGARLPFVYR